MKKLLEDLVKCVDSLQAATGAERILLKLLQKLIKNLIENITKGQDIVSCCAYLKLTLETTILLKYLREKYRDNQEGALRELQIRSRKGQSFSIRMLTDSKHIVGRIKKEILNTYLDVCRFVHPSSDLINVLLKYQNNFDSILQDLVIRVSDYVLYLLLLTFGKNENICRVCLSYNLQRCSKYCSRS